MQEAQRASQLGQCDVVPERVSRRGGLYLQQCHVFVLAIEGRVNNAG